MIQALHAALDAALARRARMRDRPVRDVARALAAAAHRWQADPDLARELPDIANLSAPMVQAVLPLVAEQLDADALLDLHAREGRERGPSLVAHVLASNVPGLALPAIALSALAGAVALVKAGRADPLSADAFRRALAAVDPDLAATVVTAYWKGGTADVEDAILPRADVVVLTGSDASVATLARRLRVRTLAYGARTSIAVVPADATGADVDALALDVVRYEQRGCLSPTSVFVVGDAGALATRLLDALARLATTIRPPPPTIAERAARRVAAETARFAGQTVHETSHATVILGPSSSDAGFTGRTVHVQSIASGDEIVRACKPNTIECIGVAGDVSPDVESLRLHGVARLCRVGRMQRPRIDWPRGQHEPLGSLIGTPAKPTIQVERDLAR